MFGDSLVGLRLVSAVAAGLVVLCTGLLAREFGGGRGAQVLAAAGMAGAAFLLAVGHMLSTATFDLLAWTALSWLVVRALGDAGPSAELGVPPVYSGHNSYWQWGPPPESAGTTIVVGIDRDRLRRWFGSVELAARIDNGVGLDNDEQGRPVWICRDRLAPWAQVWPQLRRVG